MTLHTLLTRAAPFLRAECSLHSVDVGLFGYAERQLLEMLLLAFDDGEMLLFWIKNF